jgi:hypothetical protein
MKVTIQRQTTAGELLQEARAKYGSMTALQKYVKDHPHDTMAKLALHDLKEYKDEDPNKVIRETREIIIPDSAIDQLTVQRLQLLLTIMGLVDSEPSVRALARAVHRDIKNVSEDIRALSELGLINVKSGGRGKAHRISLPGDHINLHLIEAEA